MNAKKRFYFFTCIIFLFILATDAYSAGKAEDKKKAIPKIINAGMDVYKNKGAEEALKAWIKGGPLEGSKEVLSQASVFKQIETFYGVFQSYDLIETKEITGSVTFVYLSMNFEQGPVFASFILYKKDKSWIIVNMNFNTKPEVILPLSIFETPK